MRLVAAVVVGAYQRTDQQHGGAGGAHDARKASAEREYAGIEPGRAVQIAGNIDAARDREQGQQQNNERYVLQQGGMQQLVPGQTGAIQQRERQQKGQGPEHRHFAEVVMREARREQRQEGDREQHASERDHPDQPEYRAAEGAGVGSRERGGGKTNKQKHQCFHAGPRLG